MTKRSMIDSLRKVPGGKPSFLGGVFEENARLIQWQVFFVSVTRSVNFFPNIIKLNYVQNIYQTPEPRPKQKYRRPDPRKHRIPPLVFFTRIFSALCDFF